MIFKTFENNDIDKWTAKIGLFGKSFNDVIDSINKRKLDIDNLMSSGLVSSYSDAKKQVGGLFSYLYSKKDIKSQLIDVDSIFPKIDTSNVDEIKTKIVKMSKSISDGKKTWQELFDALPSGEKYFAELGQQMEGQIITEEGLISANQKARASTIAHNNALKQQTLGAKAASIAMKGLALAGNMLAMYLTTKLLQGLYELSQVSKSVAKNAQEMGEAFNSAKSDLSLYRDKVETLQKTIRDSASSTEEVIEARKSLLSIQDELIEKYGTEKEAIVNISLALDSNTDFIDKNASAWERLTDAQWQVQKNKFNDGGFWNDMGNTLSGYSDNIDRMINEYGNYKVNINVGEISGLDNRKEVENILKEFGDLDYTDAGVAQIELKGNATDVYNQLLKIQKKVNEIEGDYTSNFTKALTKMANEASDVSDKYKDAYNSYLLQEKIFPNDEYRSILNEINSLADAYNEAFTSGDEDKIKEVFEKYASYISNLNLNDKPVLDFFKGMYPKLQTVVDKWTFETEIIPKFDTSSLNRMNSNDIYAFLNTGGIQEGENIFNELLSSAEEFGLVTGTNSEKVSQLIELLEELGIIQKAMKKEAFDASEHSLSDIFSLKDSSNNLTDLGKISEEIDNIQTAAKGLKEAMDAYNSTGVISIDQLQAILSYGDKYLKYITDENGNLVLNEEAIKNVAHARLEELRAKTLDNLYSNLENITNEKTAQAYLASQTLDTAESYEVLAKAKLDAWKVDALKNRDKNGMSISTINKVYSNMLKQYTAINNLFDNTNLASIFDATTSSANKTETALDRITKKYKELTDVIGSNLNLIKSQISLLETRGSTVGRGYYDELISQSTEKINVLTEQYNELRKQFLQTDKGTEEWLELNAAILETQNAIIGAKADIEGFQNSIDKLHWDEFDKIADVIGNISDEAKSVVDLLNTDDVLDDNGNFTKDAITALAMYGEQLESAQYLINKYSKEIEYLNGEYTKGTITIEEYNEKMQNLNDKQWESVDAYNAAKKAIIELRKKGIEEEIDALENLYDARKKAWEQEKDQHDWEKTVSENETNINKLKAQIAELQNDNSLAGIKKRKELEDELNKAESDWEDTLYDHVYDERQDQLDKELDDKKNALEKTLDDEEKLVADSINLVNKNSTTILDNLNRLSREYGIQMSNSLTEPFTHGENALSHYSTMFSETNSAFTEQLNYTAMGIYQLQLDADNAAVSVVNMFNSANGTLLEQLSLVRQSLQEITDKANEAANAVRNAGIATPTTTTTTASNSTSSTNRSLGDMAHDTSGTTLPNAGTWKNVQNDIEKAKKDLETIEKQKKVGLVKNTPNKFTTISKGYASGTQSATKGLHPICENGVEIIEKDGCLIYPIGAFDGGEKVFSNEQTQRLWELSQNPDVMEKFRQELLNIKPCIDFKFGTSPVTKTNQNVNVQQHFDALIKVEGDMTPSVYDQLVNDKRIDKLLEGKTFTYFANAYNTRGYKL